MDAMDVGDTATIAGFVRGESIASITPFDTVSGLEVSKPFLPPLYDYEFEGAKPASVDVPFVDQPSWEVLYQDRRRLRKRTANQRKELRSLNKHLKYWAAEAKSRRKDWSDGYDDGHEDGFSNGFVASNAPERFRGAMMASGLWILALALLGWLVR